MANISFVWEYHYENVENSSEKGTDECKFKMGKVRNILVESVFRSFSLCVFGHVDTSKKALGPHMRGNIFSSYAARQ